MENIENEILKKANSLINKDEAQPSTIIETPQMKVEIDTKKSYEQQAKDIVGVMATQKAIEDTQLVEDITEKKKQELKESAEAHLKSEQAESKQADIKLQEADYGVYQGIATYAGIKKPLPMKFQKVVFLILQWILAPFIILFGTFTGIVNVIIDCSNSIFEKLAKTAKAVRVLVVSLLALFGVALIVFLAIFFIKKYSIG